jgi:hypothetical protein
MRDVRHAAITGSRATLATAALTKNGWSPTCSRSSSGGAPALIRGSSRLTSRMMSSVETAPVF